MPLHQESKELTNRLAKSDIKDYRAIYSKVIEASLKMDTTKQTVTMLVTDRADFFSLCQPAFIQARGILVSKERGYHQ